MSKVNRFWEKIVKPILIKTEAKKIIEIGSGLGNNTRNLLGYCQAMDAHLTAIDPKPLFDVKTWLDLYPEHLTVFQQPSLQILPQLEDYDVVLIDGDHNWYTVYNELKLIEKHSLKTNKLPIIFLHDTDWPFARRDLYFYPESIPEEYRQPYAQKGIVQGKSKLVDEGGLHSTYFNALYENGEKNGVLTAIEDFLKQTSFPHILMKAYSNRGLCLIVPSDNKTLVKSIKYIFNSSGM